MNDPSTSAGRPSVLGSFFAPKVFNTILIVLVAGVVLNLGIALLAAGSDIFRQITQFPAAYFVLALLFSLVPWVTHLLRMQTWVNFLGERVSAVDLLRVALGVYFGAAVSPSAVGGEPVKIGMLIQSGVKSEKAISITTLNIIEDLTFFALAVPLSLLLAPLFGFSTLEQIQTDDGQLAALGWIVLTGTVTILAAWLAVSIILRKSDPDHPESLVVVRKLHQLRATLRRKVSEIKQIHLLILRSGKSRFLWNLFLGTIQWLCRYNVATVLILGMGYQINLLEIFLLQCLVFFLMGLIPTPGATVGAEATFYLIFSTVLPAEAIALLTAGWRFFSFYFVLGLGVLVFIAASWISNRQKKGQAGRSDSVSRPTSRKNGKSAMLSVTPTAKKAVKST